MADRARVGTGDLGGVRPAGEEAGGVAFPVESGYTAPMGIRDRPGGSTTRPLRVAADSVSSTQRHAPCSRRRGLQFSSRPASRRSTASSPCSPAMLRAPRVVPPGSGPRRRTRSTGLHPSATPCSTGSLRSWGSVEPAIARPVRDDRRRVPARTCPSSASGTWPASRPRGGRRRRRAPGLLQLR